MRTAAEYRRAKNRCACKPYLGAFQRSADYFRLLNPVQREAFAVLGGRMSQPDPARSQKPLSARAAFTALFIGRQTLHLDPLLDAPLAPDLVPFLTDMALMATGAARPTPPTITLSGTPVNVPVQVYFAPPRLPSQGQPRDADFRVAGLLPDFSAGNADLGAWWPAAWPRLETGMVVWCRAVPFSPNGFRGQPVCVSAPVAME